MEKCVEVQQQQNKNQDLRTLIKRFWKVAAPYWSSEDEVQARLQLAGVFALTLATTGISVGFNFLGRDFYNALASMLTYIKVLSFTSIFDPCIYFENFCPYYTIIE